MWRRSGLKVAALAFLAWAPSGFARPQRGGHGGFVGHSRREAPARQSKSQTPIDRFESMSPEEQQRALARLPPDQRQRVERQLSKFNALPPQQQQALRNLYTRLHQLPAKQQEAVHKAIDRFSKLPMDRQQAVREQLRSLAPLSESDRALRLKGGDFRHDLNRKEQGIVRDMLPLFTSK